MKFRGGALYEPKLNWERDSADACVVKRGHIWHRRGHIWHTDSTWRVYFARGEHLKGTCCTGRAPPGYISVCIGYILVYIGVYWYIWVYIGIYRCIWVYAARGADRADGAEVVLDLGRDMWVCIGIYRYISVYIGLYWYILQMVYIGIWVYIVIYWYGWVYVAQGEDQSDGAEVVLDLNAAEDCVIEGIYYPYAIYTDASIYSKGRAPRRYILV